MSMMSLSALSAAAARAAIGLSVLSMCACTLGCNAPFAADVRNKTPQPLFAQIFRKTGSESAVLAASARLGPGDRALIGPITADKDGGAYLAVDTLPNPGRPATVDLLPGTNFFEVQQDGEGTIGPIRIVPK